MNGEVSRGVTHPPVVYSTLLGSRVQVKT